MIIESYFLALFFSLCIAMMRATIDVVHQASLRSVKRFSRLLANTGATMASRRVYGLWRDGRSDSFSVNRGYPFAFNCASFAAINARMSSDISRSFSHCSL